MTKPQIVRVCGREILDSRGNPTVEATVVLADGTVGVASVPSGASTGIYEACELRDNDKDRYGGMGVLQAVSNLCNILSPALSGTYASDQSEVDRIINQADGTKDKSNLGANATLAVSLAAARASANWYGIPVYRYLGGIDAHRLPIPMMNVINGGRHAGNSLDIQEFMIVPVGAESFSEALRMCSEIYHRLGSILSSHGKSTSVGDEGGYAPDLENDTEAIEYILEAIEQAGYTENRVSLALDAAASEWYRNGIYKTEKHGNEYTSCELIDYWKRLVNSYPIVSIEDGLDQRDWDGWVKLTELLSKNIMLVGDDLFVTNSERLREGIDRRAANSILIKPNQCGTLTETLETIHLAVSEGYKYIISHRSGETEDTTIADLAVAVNANYIKSGAPCRTERIAKYNRLLRIEASLSCPTYCDRASDAACRTCNVCK